MKINDQFPMTRKLAVSKECLVKPGFHIIATISAITQNNVTIKWKPGSHLTTVVQVTGSPNLFANFGRKARSSVTYYSYESSGFRHPNV